MLEVLRCFKLCNVHLIVREWFQNRNTVQPKVALCVKLDDWVNCFLMATCVISLDVVLEEFDVVLSCFECWRLPYAHDDDDDVRCVARVGCTS